MPEMNSEQGEGGAGLQLPDRVRLMRDGFFQNAAIVVSSLIGLLVVPLLLHGLGERSYGLWLTAAGVAALVAVFDLGLGTTITREVATAQSEHDTSLSVRSAANVYLLIGISGGVVVFAAGLVVRPALQLDADLFRQSAWVFGLTGAGLLADTLSIYAVAVLAGIRRFGVVSLLSLAPVATRAIGIVFLLRAHHGLVALVAWQTLSSFVFALVGLTLVDRLAPRFRLRISRIQWAHLRAVGHFAMTSQIANAAGIAMTRVPVILIGLLRGSAPVAPFVVAQRFPLAFEQVLWRASDVLLPAIRAHSTDRSVVREVFAIGARWTLLIALPGTVTLAVLGPRLLHAWIGAVSPEVLLVFRITTAAVIIESVGHAAEQVLWGQGLTRQLLVVTVARSMIALALCAFLIPRFGIVGAALGLIGGITIGTVICIRAASSHCGVGVLALFGSAVHGVILPTALCGCVGWATSRLLPGTGWMNAGSAVVAAAVTYALSLSFGSAREEERALAWEVLGAPIAPFKWLLGRWRSR